MVGGRAQAPTACRVDTYSLCRSRSSLPPTRLTSRGSSPLRRRRPSGESRASASLPASLLSLHEHAGEDGAVRACSRAARPACSRARVQPTAMASKKAAWAAPPGAAVAPAEENLARADPPPWLGCHLSGPWPPAGPAHAQPRDTHPISVTPAAAPCSAAPWPCCARRRLAAALPQSHCCPLANGVATTRACSQAAVRGARCAG